MAPQMTTQLNVAAELVWTSNFCLRIDILRQITAHERFISRDINGLALQSLEMPILSRMQMYCCNHAHASTLIKIIIIMIITHQGKRRQQFMEGGLICGG